MTDFDVRLADSNTNTAKSVQVVLDEYFAKNGGQLGTYSVFMPSEYCIYVVRVDISGMSPCIRCACYCSVQLVDTTK